MMNRRRKRREARESEFPAEWRQYLAAGWAAWHSLSRDERERLEGLVKVFVADKRWEAARGFALTDEIRVVIAAQACLLILELDLDYYRGVGSIIVHPRAMVQRGQHATETPGVMSSDPFTLAGQAHYGGPVIITWDAARFEARHPDGGYNVVLHEFAHKLDMLDGVVDGTPPLADAESRQRWIAVCTAEFAALTDGTDGTGGSLIRQYGAVSAGEFFAVATETFFCRPIELRAEKPELYRVLSEFFRQDPALRSASNGSC